MAKIIYIIEMFILDDATQFQFTLIIICLWSIKIFSSIL